MNFTLQKQHKIFTSKIILGVLVLATGMILIDNLLPVKHTEERIIGKEMTETNGRHVNVKYYHIHTLHFKFSTDNMFYFRANDSFPVKISYSPIFNVVKKAAAPNSDDPKKIMECETKNSPYTNYWFIPLIFFCLSVSGLFINDEQADRTFAFTVVFFSAAVAFAFLSF